MIAAIGAGGFVRFVNLGALEMSPDEGASWAAASAPDIRQVITLQAQLNPGKLPIHDLMLHGWIGIFGSSMAAMRALSAALGTISILLVYWVACELAGPEPDADAGLSREDVRLAAALSALVFAVNLVTIKYSREARMYPVMLAGALAQTAIFLRALRSGGWGNYVALAILTALAIAPNFSAVLVPATEGLWLGYVLARARGHRGSAGARVAATGCALAAGAVVLAPKLLSSFRSTTVASAGGHLRWIKSPSVFAPFALFNKATGSVAFPIMAALAIWGGLVMWRRGARDAVGFALIWMWLPPIMMLLGSYLLTPIFVERYALTSFVPFFILAGMGIFEMPANSARAVAAAIAVTFSLGHVYFYTRKPHDAQYREAVAAALAALKPGETMTVAPPYAIEVARYYLAEEHRDRAVRYQTGQAAANVIIRGDQGAARDGSPPRREEYPETVARLRGVSVFRK